MTTSAPSRVKDQRARDYERAINYLNRTKNRKNIPVKVRLNIILILIVTVITIAVIAVSNL